LPTTAPPPRCKGLILARSVKRVASLHRWSPQQERQKQDALLETLERSAELVAKKSDRIHRELRMQNQ